MKNNDNSDPRDKIELKNCENLYQIKDKHGQIVDYEKADGRQLFNHYRHNMTNYDEVLDSIRVQQGYVNGHQQKKAAIGAAEKVLAKYKEEHTKVVKDSLRKSNALKKILDRAKLGTASAVVNLLDNWSEQIKKVNNLEDSQRKLRQWNDTYRVQKELTKKLLKEANIDSKVIAGVNAIYCTKSVNKAVEKGCDIFDLEKSEVLKIVKKAIKYTKLV